MIKHCQLKIVVVIPAFNEQASIKEIVSRVRQFASVIVANDGSSDLTAEYAQAAGAEVINHAVNQGYDRALETGMQRALFLGYDAAITMDADAQHNPDLLKLFIYELEKGADLVIGVRDKTQRISERLFAFITNMIWSIQDPLCGMKAYHMKLMHKAVHFDTYGSIGTELMLRAVKSGSQTVQIPLIAQDRLGISRFGGGWRPNYRILRSLVYGLFYAPSL